ncbi:MAG: phosphatase [marine bacterium B5-7]|nr:MAG: phosphatase [marine bacterium B5-7]
MNTHLSDNGFDHPVGIYDLHCHSNHSDGELDVATLIERAKSRGVTCLSITDHDTVSAYRVIESLDHGDMRIIPGIEFSTFWRKIGVHVLGLHIDPECYSIVEGEAQQRRNRAKRARQIAERLGKLGLGNLLGPVEVLAGDRPVGRPHFATQMVRNGQVWDMREAFTRYLGDGRPGDVKCLWPGMETIIDWIKKAGGVAVLAHPLKYRLTHTRLRLLLEDFKQMGGGGIEVISGRQETHVSHQLASLSTESGLLASCGSDFHRECQPWADLGCNGSLPKQCVPVWHDW